jgi:hypothetical protein
MLGTVVGILTDVERYRGSTEAVTSHAFLPTLPSTTTDGITE